MSKNKSRCRVTVPDLCLLPLQAQPLAETLTQNFHSTSYYYMITRFTRSSYESSIWQVAPFPAMSNQRWRTRTTHKHLNASLLNLHLKKLILLPGFCLKNLRALKEILKQNQTSHRYSCADEDATLRMILTQQDCCNFTARSSQP